jgi:hypothetical protein
MVGTKKPNPFDVLDDRLFNRNRIPNANATKAAQEGRAANVAGASSSGIQEQECEREARGPPEIVVQAARLHE